MELDDGSSGRFKGENEHADALFPTTSSELAAVLVVNSVSLSRREVSTVHYGMCRSDFTQYTGSLPFVSLSPCLVRAKTRSFHAFSLKAEDREFEVEEDVTSLLMSRSSQESRTRTGLIRVLPSFGNNNSIPNAPARGYRLICVCTTGMCLPGRSFFSKITYRLFSVASPRQWRYYCCCFSHLAEQAHVRPPILVDTNL